MTEQTIANTGTAPTQMLADAGYCSESNLTAAAAITEQTGTDILSATGRLGHDEKLPAAPRGPIPTGFTAKQPMARELRTKTGRPTRGARRSWHRFLIRLPPCRANTSCSEGWTTPAVSGSCSRRPVTYANFTAASAPPD